MDIFFYWWQYMGIVLSDKGIFNCMPHGNWIVGNMIIKCTYHHNCVYNGFGSTVPPIFRQTQLQTPKTPFYFYLEDLINSEEIVSFLFVGSCWFNFSSKAWKVAIDLPARTKMKRKRSLIRRPDVEEIEPDDEEPWLPTGDQAIFLFVASEGGFWTC